jgi:hypothetical protein
MYEGFYIVQFAGMEGKGGGVAVISNGRIFGGDNAYTYTGQYEVKSGGILATVDVQNFEPSIGNVMGIKGNYTLALSLTLQGGVLVGQGVIPSVPGFGIKVKLTLRSKLT